MCSDIRCDDVDDEVLLDIFGCDGERIVFLRGRCEGAGVVDNDVRWGREGCLDGGEEGGYCGGLYKIGG